MPVDIKNYAEMLANLHNPERWSFTIKLPMKNK